MTIADRISQASIDLERRGRLAGFLQVARCLLVGGRNPFEVREAATAARCTQVVLDGLTVQKASVAAATTTDSTWAAPLAQTQLADAFGESLRDSNAFDRILNDGAFLRVPPATKVTAITAGISGAIIGEGTPKAAGQISAAQFEVSMKKSVAFVVLTKELMSMSSPGALAMLKRELQGSVSSVTDTQFVSDLTTGISTIPSSGSTALAVRADMRAALDAVDTGSASRLYWITTSSIGKRLAAIGDASGAAAFPETADGRLGPWPLLISDGVGSGLLILVDASSVGAAALPIELDASDQTTIQLDTAPDSPPTGSTNLVSLFQLNGSALRATRYFGIKRLRDTAVAIVSNVTGIGNSPS